MISTVETALASALDAATTWPVRWANGQWPSGTSVSEGNLPFDNDGAPAPAIEAEVIGGQDALHAVGRSADGKRTTRWSGLFRCYLSVAQGGGLGAINDEAAAIVSAFARASIIGHAGADEHLVMADPRIDDGVAGYEEGNRYVRMVSIPFDYFHRRTQP